MIPDYFYKSVTAKKYGIDNYPKSDEIIRNLYLVDQFIVKPLFKEFPNLSPTKITQMFRSWVLTKKLIELGYKASKTSKHLEGKALDIIYSPYDPKEIMNYLKKLPTKGTYISKIGHIHTELDTAKIDGFSIPSGLPLVIGLFILLYSIVG